MDCRTNCPKIAEFESIKASLASTSAELDRAEELANSASVQNRSSRRAQAKLDKRQASAHEAVRSLSDAEFYQSEAFQQIKVGRAQVAEALEAQDNAIETFISFCPTRSPIETRQMGQVTLMCALDSE